MTGEANDIRMATPDDADAIAAIHVAAWAETYTGLLPAVELTKIERATRRGWWAAALGRGGTRVALAPGLGFAAVGPQRDARLAPRYPRELHALYLLAPAHGTGLGRRLFDRAAGDGPLSAFVLDGNARAIRFYEKTGARFVERRKLGDGWPDDLLYVWDRPAT